MEKINIQNILSYKPKEEMWLDRDEVILQVAEKVNEIVEWINALEKRGIKVLN